MPALRAAHRRIAIAAKSDLYYGLSIGMVDSSAAWVWGQMSEAIWRIGGKAEEVVADLIVLLKTLSSSTGKPAAESLSLIGPEARAAVPALVGLLKHEGHFELQKAAAIALGAIGPDARTAVPALVKCLRQKEVAPVAAAALKKIDPEAAAKAGIR